MTDETKFYQVEDGWMETFSGQKFHFGAPTPESIHINDIAHALSNLCRYGGHTRKFYSVAEHCCLMSDWVLSSGHSPQVALEALMHDATEAYLVDMPRPIKHKLPGYRAIEDGLARAIADRFYLTCPSLMLIHEADSRILVDERAQAMSDSGHNWGMDGLAPLGVTLKFWEPHAAETEFLGMFNLLDDARSR